MRELDLGIAWPGPQALRVRSDRVHGEQQCLLMQTCAHLQALGCPLGLRAHVAVRHRELLARVAAQIDCVLVEEARHPERSDVSEDRAQRDVPVVPPFW